jgi:hypothetical protein
MRHEDTDYQRKIKAKMRIKLHFENNLRMALLLKKPSVFMCLLPT